MFAVDLDRGQDCAHGRTRVKTGRHMAIVGWAGVRAAGGALVLFFLLAGAAGATEPRSVLLIYADTRLSPAFASIDETLRATIESRAPAPVRWYSEHLDPYWFPHDQERYIGRAMREKYAGRTFDLVIACGESALRFALRERDALFPRTPIVFCKVEDEAARGGGLPPDVTGVTLFRDWAAGVDLILRLHPGTRRIAVVGGAGPIEREWERAARWVFSRYEDRLAFTYLTGLPMEDTVAAVAALPPDSVVVFTVLLRDGAGRAFSSPDALAQLAPVAKVPIYGYAETHLGYGIVGGPLISYRAQAGQAAELALRVLGGERLGPPDIVRREPYHYMFDARQLERWSISESRLPPGSQVHFRRPSPWSQYKWLVLGAAAFVVAQTLLIVGLLVERRRYRLAQRRLDERLRFEILLADLAAAFVEIPSNEVDARIGDGLQRILDELGLDRARLVELEPGSDRLWVSHIRGRGGPDPALSGFTAEDWPWVISRLRRGQTVYFARLADLPEEAVSDRQSFAALGTKSMVIMPLLVGGTVVGALGCGMVQRERDWPEELVDRLRLLADIFAVVLMRHRADTALAESEGRFHLMADAAPVMMWMAGPDGRCTGVNRAWLDFTGQPLAEQLGDGWLEGVHPEDRDSFRRSYAAALAARQPFTVEYRLRRADGAYREVLDRGQPNFDRAHVFRGFVGSATDVTEVRAGQEALVESLKLRSAILGSLYGQLAAVDRTGVIIAVNESWTRFTQEMGGDPRTTGIGANYLDVCRRAASAGDPHVPVALEAIDGVLAGRTPRAMLEYPCTTPSGMRWYAMIVEPFKRPEGGLVISHIDITRRREAEEQAQREREELAHVLRLATLGELATSLAHEINQPLTAIAANAQVARRLLAEAQVDPEVPAVLRDIGDDAQRAAQVIRRLRVLFKKEHVERQTVDVNEVIKEVIGLLSKHLERHQVRLELSRGPRPARVLGDVVQLQQVILNVIMNAAEAMTAVADPRELHVAILSREPEVLTITVRDTGTGVDSSELEHIFDRFVTAKPEGLGMGLSISRSIITAHGGRMWATRNLDRGLTIHIELPCLEG